MLLNENNLNIIEVLISKALIEAYISNDEFFLVNYVSKNMMIQNNENSF